ncbi:hypothetical protein Taro_012690 [Colocasia esculenta]|uniref:Uncharacterized protein n=1 Tax=Colocasia esculenta TaxID=4460 RepID=A0A843UDP7_COLES|nr:hypothetical protein [Colocasia esculenta]
MPQQLPSLCSGDHRCRSRWRRLIPYFAAALQLAKIEMLRTSLEPGIAKANLTTCEVEPAPANDMDLQHDVVRVPYGFLLVVGDEASLIFISPESTSWYCGQKMYQMSHAKD